MTYIRFCAALAAFASLAFGQNIDSSRIRYTAPGTGATQQSLTTVLKNHHNVTDFGVVCDGVTDNSAALATAITAAATGNWTLDFPSGTCAFSTTLNMGYGVPLHGISGTGFGFTALLYTGTGSALLYKNLGGNHFIYNPYLDHIAIQVSGHAQYGIEAYELSQAYFNDVLITPTGSGTLQTGFYCGQITPGVGCNIGTFNHTTISQTSSHAVELISSAALTFRDDDFYNIGGADFAVGGITTQLAIKDGWHEMQNIGVLLDDTLIGGALNVFGLEVQNSRFLFNNNTFPNQIVFKANNSAGNQMYVSNFVFRDNTIGLANAGLTNTLYPFQVVWSASPGAGSIFRGTIDNTYISGIQNTGAFLSTTNGTIGQTVVTFKDVVAYDQTGTTFTTESSGSGTQYQSIKNNSGSISLGRNNQKFGATLTLQDNDSANGKTNLAIYDGPNQGAYSALSLFDPSGNLKSYFDLRGLAFSSGYGTSFHTGSAGNMRWWNLLQGTESGGNTGSNWTLCRYSDAGALIDCPLVVNRVDGSLSATTFSGLVTNTSGGYKFPDGTTQTSAGIQPSAVVISANTSVSSSGSKNQTFIASGNITVTLYAASASPGGIVTVKKTDASTNTITINTSGGNIDGQSSVTLLRQSDSYSMISDGTNWWLF